MRLDGPRKFSVVGRRSVASLSSLALGDTCQRYYSATILQMSGIRDDRLAIWLSWSTALTNFLFTLLGVWLVERVGRRKLTLGSLMGTCASLVLLAVGFLLAALHTPPVTFHPSDPALANSTCVKYQMCEQCMLDPSCGFCYRDNGSGTVRLSCAPVTWCPPSRRRGGRCSNTSQGREQTFWAYNYCPTPYSWLVLLGLLLYLAAFAPVKRMTIIVTMAAVTASASISCQARRRKSRRVSLTTFDTCRRVPGNSGRRQTGDRRQRTSSGRRVSYLIK
ncbi:hypothetical protein CRUP_033017 [Coryphaenoides rupestris]|nr:hypothetical protein CRUP_033017 [Coryphaenoides rupestris]